MGRPRRPSALRVLQGEKVRTSEPRVSGQVKPPVSLTVEGRALWDELAAPMYRSGILTVIDVPAFTELIESMVLAKFYRAQMRLQLTGTAVAPGQASAVYQYARLIMVLNQGWAQFGMTPSSRSKLIAAVVDGGPSGHAANDILSS